MNDEEWEQFERRVRIACECDPKVSKSDPYRSPVACLIGSALNRPRPVPKLVAERVGVDFMVLEALNAGFDGWPVDERYDLRAYDLGRQLGCAPPPSSYPRVGLGNVLVSLEEAIRRWNSNTDLLDEETREVLTVAGLIYLEDHPVAGPTTWRTELGKSRGLKD